MGKVRWWLTEDSVDMVINAAPELIYDMVADLPRMGEWSPECQTAEWTNESTGPAVGATFVGHNRGGPFNKVTWSRKGHVLAADRGHEFAFTTEEGKRDSTVWRYRMEQLEGGTKVTEGYEIRWLPLWARILDGPVNRRKEIIEGMTHTLTQLKAAAEAKANQTAQA